jgi:Abortive infection alpha
LLGHIHSNLPFVTVRSVAVEKPTVFTEKADLLTGLENKLPLTFPHNIAAYFSNFAGLGIIEIRRNIVSDHPALYEDLEKSYGPRYEYRTITTLTIKFVRGKIDITPFGELFIEACLGPLKTKDL